MTDCELKTLLVEWFQHPMIAARGWSSQIFWYKDQTNPFAKLRVDARELEIVFTTVLGLPSHFSAQLDAEKNGRGRFIINNIKRHELPLLSRADT